ncbi:MAG: monovalent cation/H+ antiporter complex subunit F [Clostridia bacterium]|nr:monovalent cation/H+ antiporter complex subunit F [Clostridia bacterium]
MDEAWRLMAQISLGVIGILIFLCVIRLIRGPKVADRIVGANMLTTLVTVAICIMALMLGEGYLVDVALIFCLLSFLAVALLSKVYIGIWSKNQAEKRSGTKGARS